MTLVISKGITLRKDFVWNETIWNPSMISTALWLDAADNSTITASSGVVSQWNDKSGNSRNAVERAGIGKPTLATAVQNNLNTIRFNGAQAFSVPTAASMTRNIGGFSIIAIRKFAALPATEQNIFRASTNGFSSRVFFGAGATAANKVQVGGRRLDADSFASVASSGDASTTLFEIQSGIYDYANSDLYLHINGTLIASSTSFQANGSTSDTDSQLVAIGGGGGFDFTAGFFNGDIGELVALPTAASLDTRQRIEGYLAHKWGLTASLPIDHPYKTVGPTP
jgi:hypothetical protein